MLHTHVLILIVICKKKKRGMEGLESRYELARLISRRLSGSATPEEEERLRRWREESEEHGREYETICKRLAVDLRRTDHPDVRKAWREVRGRLPRTRRLAGYRWPVAAAGCAGVMLLLGWMFLRTGEQPVSRPEGDRSGGTVLILGNGERVDLKQERVVDLGSGAKIMIGEKGMSYRTGEQAKGPEQELNTVWVPRGGEYRLVLSDGTKVWLNAGSQLTYPVRFTGERREVVMKGEACFEVAKTEGRSFVVKAGDVEVAVSGTLFNVEAYPENEEVKTTLVNGKVEVVSGSSREVLVPDEQAVVNRDREIRVEKVCAEEYIGWTRGEFRFTRMRLEEVMTKLARWYNVEVFFAVPALKNVRFTLNLKRYDDIAEVLSKIEKTGRVHFRVQEQCIVVE